MAAEDEACDEQHSVKHRRGEICSNFCREKEPWKSWLNLVCVHLVFTFLISGQMQLAVIYDVLVETYEVSKAKVGIVGSLIIVFQSVGGLLGAPALSLLGSRKVSLFASLLLVVGYAGSAYAPNLICFHIFYGVFSGLGAGILAVSGATIIQESFSHNRGLATGISLLGYSTGITLCPILTEYLLRNYALSGCLLIASAISCHLFVISLLLQKANIVLQMEALNGDIVEQNQADEKKMCLTVSDTSSINISIKATSGAGDIVEQNQADEQKMCLTVSDTSSINISIKGTSGADTKQNLNHGASDAIEQPSIGNEHCSESHIELEEMAKLSIHFNPKTPQKQDGHLNSSTNKIIMDYFSTLIDMSICHNVRLVLLIFARSSWSLARLCLLLHITSCALQLGVTEVEARHLTSVIGIIGFIIRCISAVLLNIQCINTEAYFMVGTICMFFADISASFASGYTTLVLAMVLFGLAEGVSFTSMPLVVVHAVGVDNYAKAFSLMEISLLPAAIAAGPFSGWLADISNGYRVVFLFAAGSSLICFTLTLTLLILSLKAKGVHCQKIDCSLQKS